jgi:hypothetical protein
MFRFSRKRRILVGSQGLLVDDRADDGREVTEPGPVGIPQALLDQRIRGLEKPEARVHSLRRGGEAEQPAHGLIHDRRHCRQVRLLSRTPQDGQRRGPVRRQSRSVLSPREVMMRPIPTDNVTTCCMLSLPETHGESAGAAPPYRQRRGRTRPEAGKSAVRPWGRSGG